MGIFDLIVGNGKPDDEKHRSKRCKQIVGKIVKEIRRSEPLILKKIKKFELTTVDYLVADKREEAKAMVLQIVGLRRKLAFNRDAIPFCAAISPCSDALFCSKKCPQDLEVPVANLVYAATRRCDFPLLLAFRDLVETNYKLGKDFLNFPGDTYARGTKITPEVHRALQAPYPDAKQIQVLFDDICLRHGAVHWKGFSSGLANQLGNIEKNLYK